VNVHDELEYRNKIDEGDPEEIKV